MDFALFILVNVATFLRPAEISPALAGVPVYLILILACTLVALPRLLAQWASQPLGERPITVCVLGVLAAVVMSHLARGNAGLAWWWGVEFGKVVLYYLLLVGIVDSPSRLRQFLIWLLICIGASAGLSLLQYHGVIDIPTLKVLERHERDPATGDDYIIWQLVGTGIFNDPNDLCVILSMGVLIGLYFARDRCYGPARLMFLMPVALIGYALYLTQSRGGLLALIAGLMTVFAIQLGTKKAILLAVIGLPVVLAGLGGRFAKMSSSEDTAQQRIELWREALVLFRGSPAFGIGVNRLDGEIGLVAHNSYVHAYAETGFFGGTAFVGAFFLAVLILHGAGRWAADAEAPGLTRLRPYLWAILASYLVALYSITRIYVASTYLPLGLIEAYQRFVPVGPAGSGLRIGGKVMAATAAASFACLVALNVFVRIFAQ